MNKWCVRNIQIIHQMFSLLSKKIWKSSKNRKHRVPIEFFDLCTFRVRNSLASFKNRFRDLVEQDLFILAIFARKIPVGIHI